MKATEWLEHTIHSAEKLKRERAAGGFPESFNLKENKLEVLLEHQLDKVNFAIETEDWENVKRELSGLEVMCRFVLYSAPDKHPELTLDLKAQAESENNRRPLEIEVWVDAVVALRDRNFTYREIAEWLCKRGIEVDHNEVYRAHVKNPENAKLPQFRKESP